MAGRTLCVIATFLYTVTVCVAVNVNVNSIPNDVTKGIRPGQNVVLKCDVTVDANKWDAIVYWDKIVNGQSHEVSNNRDLKGAFKTVGRFAVNGMQGPGQLQRKYDLNITGIRVVDGGLYQCRVGTQPGATAVQIDVNVISAVTNLTLNNFTYGQEIDVLAGNNMDINCVASGSSIKPGVEISVGDVSVTNQFNENTQMVVYEENGIPGTMYSVRRYNSRYPINPNDHEKRLACSATVPTLSPQSTFVELDVSFKPKVKCSPVANAKPGKQDVQIICTVSANPSFKNVKWTLPSGNETMGSNEAKGDITTSQKKNSADPSRIAVDLVLTIGKVQKSHFGVYSLYVQNSLGDASDSSKLVEDASEVRSSSSVLLPTIFLTILAMLLHWIH